MRKRIKLFEQFNEEFNANESMMSEIDLIGKDAATKEDFLKDLQAFLSANEKNFDAEYAEELSKTYFNEDGSKISIEEAAEHIGNLGILHQDAAMERLNAWQKENATTPIEAGDYVKMAFMDGKETEWMWVNITKIIDKDNFEGKLSNDPILVHNIKDKDKVVLNRKQIAQLFKKDKAVFSK